MGVTLGEIAKVCHEVNRAYCLSIGDDSQKPWESAASWQRGSALEGVLFRIENPDAPVSAIHEAWAASKRAEGWVYWPEKDAANKRHNCLVPWDELPPEQRAKDHLFCAVVDSLRASYLGG